MEDKKKVKKAPRELDDRKIVTLEDKVSIIRMRFVEGLSEAAIGRKFVRGKKKITGEPVFFSRQSVNNIIRTFQLPEALAKDKAFVARVESNSNPEDSIDGITDENLLDIARLKFYGEKDESIADVMNLSIVQLYKCYKKLMGTKRKAYETGLGEKKKAAGEKKSIPRYSDRVRYYPALEEYRLKENETLREIAIYAEVELRTLEQVLCGSRFMPRDVVDRISRVTQIPIAKIMEEQFKLDPIAAEMLEEARKKYMSEQNV